MTWSGHNGVARALVSAVGLGIFLYAGAASFGSAPRVLPAFRTVGSAFFPEDDRSEFIMALETPPGSNLEYTRLKAEEAAQVVRAMPEVRYTYTTLGGGANGAVDVGSIYVKLVPKNTRSRSVETLARVVRAEMQRVAGATISVFTSDFSGDRKS